MFGAPGVEKSSIWLFSRMPGGTRAAAGQARVAGKAGRQAPAVPRQHSCANCAPADSWFICAASPCACARARSLPRVTSAACYPCHAPVDCDSTLLPNPVLTVVVRETAILEQQGKEGRSAAGLGLARILEATWQHTRALHAGVACLPAQIPACALVSSAILPTPQPAPPVCINNRQMRCAMVLGMQPSSSHIKCASVCVQRQRAVVADGGAVPGERAGMGDREQRRISCSGSSSEKAAAAAVTGQRRQQRRQRQRCTHVGCGAHASAA